MARDDAPNPYIDLPLVELHQRLMARAQELNDGKPVTRKDLAFLCIAAAWAIAPHDSAPVSSTDRIRAGESMVDVLGSLYDREAAVLRRQMLRTAVETLDLPTGSAWPADVLVAVGEAYESEVRLTDALQIIEKLRRSRVSHS